MNISLGIPLFLQTALLVIYYGFNISMPWWVVWFPFLVVGGILGVVLGFVLIVLIISLIAALFEY